MISNSMNTTVHFLLNTFRFVCHIKWVYYNAEDANSARNVQMFCMHTIVDKTIRFHSLFCSHTSNVDTWTFCNFRLPRKIFFFLMYLFLLWTAILGCVCVRNIFTHRPMWSEWPCPYRCQLIIPNINNNNCLCIVLCPISKRCTYTYEHL